MKNGNRPPNKDYSDNKDRFAEVLEEKRIDGGYKQKEFCKKIGVPDRTYREWIGGKTDHNKDGKIVVKKTIPDNIETLLNLCDILKVSLDYLFGRTKYNSINNEMISKETGLDDESIQIICEMNKTPSPEHERWLETLNDIIHEPNIIYVISDIIYAKKLYGVLEESKTPDEEGLNENKQLKFNSDENDYSLISETENGSILRHSITDEIMNAAYWRELENLIKSLEKKNNSKVR